LVLTLDSEELAAYFSGINRAELEPSVLLRQS
jgi:hypothetical protein